MVAIYPQHSMFGVEQHDLAIEDSRVHTGLRCGLIIWAERLGDR
jgi:hypothetical protein